MHGIKFLINKLHDIPSSYGVYKMIDNENHVIYVGKAKNLYKRISSYTRGNLPTRILAMVEMIADIGITITNSEVEAFLLEMKLIKEFHPKFNILLKDDKSFPYIKIVEHNFPRIIKYRGKNHKGCYGPFPSSIQVNKALTAIQKIFRLRNCSDSYFSSRTRPCIQYQIGRCSAPCTNKITKEEYAKSVKQAKLFMLGKASELQKNLTIQMQNYSDAMNYEQAAIIRDRLQAVNIIQARTSINKIFSSADVIGIASNKNTSIENTFCISIEFYRNNQNYGNKIYYFSRPISNSKEAMLTDFISQFYYDKPMPYYILTLCKFEDSNNLVTILNDLHKSKTKIIFPEQEELKIIIDTANNNAEHNLKNYLAKFIKNTYLLKQLQKTFKINKPINRIEVYDNSHIMGNYAIGAMVVIENGNFIKSEYRKFKVDSKRNDNIVGGDDYYMLEQVIIKRFRSTLKNKPDLMLIDGGKGHLTTATKAMLQLGLVEDISIVAIAKGKNRNARQEIFYSNNQKPFTLAQNNNIMKYLQTLRDEAHNFAIKSYKDKHNKALYKSSLDDVEGIGKVRKQILLKHFGSFSLINNASVQQLRQVSGIGPKTAKKIFDILHGNISSDS